MFPNMKIQNVFQTNISESSPKSFNFTGLLPLKVKKPIKAHWGTLYQIPEISVNLYEDAKRSDMYESEVDYKITRAFFLTHCDNSQLRDLLTKSFFTMLSDNKTTAKLYMHEFSYNFIMYKLSVGFKSEEDKRGKEELSEMMSHLRTAGSIVIFKKDQTLRLIFNGRSRYAPGKEYIVDVTILLPNSYSGNCMLYLEEYLEDENFTTRIHRILYTANCPIDPAMLYHPALMGPNPEGNNLKKITDIYLDTHYCIASYEKVLPSVDSIYEKLCDRIGHLMNDCIALGFNMQVLFHSRVLMRNMGFFKLLHKLTREKVYVSEKLHNFLENIPILGNIFTKDSNAQQSCRFHFGCKYSISQIDDDPFCTKCSLYFSDPKPYFLKVNLDDFYIPHPRESGHLAGVSNFITSDPKKEINVLLPNHPSSSEISSFLNFLNLTVNDVTPLYLPGNITNSVDVLKEIFQSVGEMRKDPSLNTISPESIVKPYDPEASNNIKRTTHVHYYLKYLFMRK